jgi:hypothetical protein
MDDWSPRPPLQQPSSDQTWWAMQPPPGGWLHHQPRPSTLQQQAVWSETPEQQAQVQGNWQQQPADSFWQPQQMPAEQTSATVFSTEPWQFGQPSAEMSSWQWPPQTQQQQHHIGPTQAPQLRMASQQWQHLEGQADLRFCPPAAVPHPPKQTALRQTQAQQGAPRSAPYRARAATFTPRNRAVLSQPLPIGPVTPQQETKASSPAVKAPSSSRPVREALAQHLTDPKLKMLAEAETPWHGPSVSYTEASCETPSANLPAKPAAQHNLDAEDSDSSVLDAEIPCSSAAAGASDGIPCPSAAVGAVQSLQTNQLDAEGPGVTSTAQAADPAELPQREEGQEDIKEKKRSVTLKPGPGSKESPKAAAGVQTDSLQSEVCLKEKPPSPEAPCSPPAEHSFDLDPLDLAEMFEPAASATSIQPPKPKSRPREKPLTLSAKPPPPRRGSVALTPAPPVAQARRGSVAPSQVPRQYPRKLNATSKAPAQQPPPPAKAAATTQALTAALAAQLATASRAPSDTYHSLQPTMVFPRRLATI